MARDIKIAIVGDASDLKRALGGAQADLETFSSKVSNVGSSMMDIGANLTKSVTLPIVAGLGLAAKAAADEGEKMAVLANLLKTNTGATDAQIAANEKWITSMQNATGVADDDLRVAMGKLVIAGRTVEQSHTDLGVAADIAAARHIDLATVVQAMSKAAQGSTGALQKLGIETKDAAGQALSYDEILQNASKTMGGSAATAAGTAAGKFEIMKLKMQDATEAIGSALLPIITKLAGWLSTLAEKFTSLSPQVQNIIVIVALCAAAIGPLVTVVGALVVTVGFLLSPVGLVIAAIALLVAGVVYAYFHFETFRDVVDSVAAFLVDVVWPALQSGMEMLIQVSGDLANGVAEAWAVISRAVQYAWDNFLAYVFDAIVVYIQIQVATIQWFVGIWQVAWDAIGNAISVVYDNVIGPTLSFIQDRIDNVRSAIDAVTGAAARLGDIAGGIGGAASSVGSFFGFAEGGVVPGPMGAAQFVVAHGGETIVPPGLAMAGGGGGNTYNITLNVGPAADKAAVGQATVEAIAAYERNNGTGWRN